MAKERRTSQEFGTKQVGMGVSQLRGRWEQMLHRNCYGSHAHGIGVVGVAGRGKRAFQLEPALIAETATRDRHNTAKGSRNTRGPSDSMRLSRLHGPAYQCGTLRKHQRAYWSWYVLNRDFNRPRSDTLGLRYIPPPSQRVCVIDSETCA